MAPTSGRRQHGALRTTTGLGLLALGSILMFAIRAAGGLVNVHVTGLVLSIVGAAWLWIPVRDKRALLVRLFESAMAYVTSSGSGAGGASCSLDELLGPTVAASRADPLVTSADVLSVNDLHD